MPTDYKYSTHYEYCSLSKNEFFESFDLRDLTPDIIDFLSPKVHNAKKTTVPVPDAIIKIFIYYLIFKNNMLPDNLNDLMYEEFEEIPTVILNIKYQDLNGDKYIRTYNVKVSAIINFTENPQKRTSPLFYYKFTEKYIT